MSGPFGIANRQALAVLRHPDRRTSWMGVLVARTYPDAAGYSPAQFIDKVTESARVLPSSIPLAKARLVGEQWVEGSPPAVEVVDADQYELSNLARRVDLSREPPVRLQMASDGSWIAVAAHHAAFDGPAAMDALRILVGGTSPKNRYSGDFVRATMNSRPIRRTVAAMLPMAEIRRLAFPADRAAASLSLPSAEVFVSSELPRLNKDVAVRIPEAVLAEIAKFSAVQGRPCFRLGLTMGLEAGKGVSNASTYRRVDIKVGEPMGDAIRRALREKSDPWEVARPSKLISYLGPVVDRLSDTVLVTNMGRYLMPPVVGAVEGYPVARGRSAVSVGVVRLSGASSTISMRCRDINKPDAKSILSAIVGRLVR